MIRSILCWHGENGRTNLTGNILYSGGLVVFFRFCPTLRVTPLLFGDGFGINEPLRLTRPAVLLEFDATEPSNADKTADFGAGRVQIDRGLLRGKPILIALRRFQGCLLRGLALGVLFTIAASYHYWQ